jgi:hypothetical protein
MARVAAKDFQPNGDVGRVVVARFGGDAEVRAQERLAALGDELPGGIGSIATSFAEVPSEALGVSGGVDKFMEGLRAAAVAKPTVRPGQAAARGANTGYAGGKRRVIHAYRR